MHIDHPHVSERFSHRKRILCSGLAIFNRGNWGIREWECGTGAYSSFTCVDGEAYTVDENDGMLCWNTQFTFCVFYQLAIVIQGIQDCSNEENRKHEWNNLFWEETKREILIFYFNVIRKPLYFETKVVCFGVWVPCATTTCPWDRYLKNVRWLTNPTNF